jgi:hypothetical protein
VEWENFSPVVLEVFDKISWRFSIVETPAIRILPGGPDPVGILVIGMHYIITQFIAYIQKNEDRTRQPHGESKHIEQGEKLLAFKIP